jgi:mannose-6-phosphate isomerase-like protein (cupin superfamily)
MFKPRKTPQNVYSSNKIMDQKELIFEQAAKMLAALDFKVVKMDDTRPWGGFFVLDETQAAQFAAHYFPDENMDALKITNKLSPKILLVAPHARLSWQYHHRRAEIWKCISSSVGVVTSDTDEEKQQHTLHEGDIIKLKQGERHRLIGLADWGMVAEIWQHTDAENPSNEDDIVRVQDDFGR